MIREFLTLTYNNLPKIIQNQDNIAKIIRHRFVVTQKLTFQIYCFDITPKLIEIDLYSKVSSCLT